MSAAVHDDRTVIANNEIAAMISNAFFLIFSLPSYIPFGTSVLRLIFYFAKVKTTYIPSSLSASSIWREILSFLVVGNVNGLVTPSDIHQKWHHFGTNMVAN